MLGVWVDDSHFSALKTSLIDTGGIFIGMGFMIFIQCNVHNCGACGEEAFYRLKIKSFRNTFFTYVSLFYPLATYNRTNSLLA